MSRLCHDLAIALRFIPWSNTSRVIIWFGRESGRITVLARGALRSKSFLLGQSDLFATSDVVFYHHGPEGLHWIRECALVRPRPGLRQHWRATVAASYVADLVTRWVPSDAPQPRLFDLLSRTLDALDRGEHPGHIAMWFELQWLALEGLAPRLFHCAACGREIGVQECYWIPARGGVVCASCAEEENTRSSLPTLPARALEALRAWQRAAEPEEATAVSLPAADWEAAWRWLGDFLRYHLHARLLSRDVAHEWWSRSTPRSHGRDIE